MFPTLQPFRTEADAPVTDRDEPTFREALGARGVPAEQVSAFFPHFLGLRLGLALEHFRRVHDLPSYFRRFTAVEMADHLRLLTEMGEQQAVAAVRRRAEADELDVIILGRDGRGVAAAITSHLAQMGFFIRDIRVATYDAPAGASGDDRYVLTFEVSGEHLSRSDLAVIEEELRSRLQQPLDRQAVENCVQRVLAECTERVVSEYQEQRRLLERLVEAARRNDFVLVRDLLLGTREQEQGGIPAAPYLAPLLLILAGSLPSQPALAEAVAEANKALTAPARPGSRSGMYPALKADRGGTSSASRPASPGGQQPGAPGAEKVVGAAALAVVMNTTLPSGLFPGGDSFSEGVPSADEAAGVAPYSCDKARELASKVQGKIRSWQSKPLPVQLRELIRICDGNPDSPAVLEFVSEHQGDEEFRQQADGLRAAFRREREFMARPAQQEVGGARFLGRWLWDSLRDALGWSAKPLPVQLRELIQRCGRDPDARAVVEFLAQHQDDPTLAQQAPSIRAAFRREREFAEKQQRTT